MNSLYTTKYGEFIVGDFFKLIKKNMKQYQGKFQLIITSPPFPLNNKKKYDNLQGEEYKKWFVSLAPIFSNLLKEDGSIVIEIGNAWIPKRPIQSLLSLESLLEFVKYKDANLRLIQEFICYNPSRLPSPAQWVTIERIRTVDSYTHAWWIAKSDYPKADNRKVLRPYSTSMKKLLKEQKFNAGKRPSGHTIGESGFLKNNDGSIMHNFIELEPIHEEKEPRLPHNVVSFSNTSSNDNFSRICRERGIKQHPAKMSLGLANFFIEFLTDPGDFILDPFAGSNTIGYCAEKLGRHWLSFDIKPEYGEQSKIRFNLEQ